MTDKKNSEIFRNVRVEYSIEATINTGNFQNVKPGYRVSATVEDGISPTLAAERLAALGKAWLEKEVETHQAELAG